MLTHFVIKDIHNVVCINRERRLKSFSSPGVFETGDLNERCFVWRFSRIFKARLLREYEQVCYHICQKYWPVSLSGIVLPDNLFFSVRIR